jgi:hypothetical protein
VSRAATGGTKPWDKKYLYLSGGDLALFDVVLSFHSFILTIKAEPEAFSASRERCALFCSGTTARSSPCTAQSFPPSSSPDMIKFR